MSGKKSKDKARPSSSTKLSASADNVNIIEQLENLSRSLETLKENHKTIVKDATSECMENTKKIAQLLIDQITQLQAGAKLNEKRCKEMERKVQVCEQRCEDSVKEVKLLKQQVNCLQVQSMELELECGQVTTKRNDKSNNIVIHGLHHIDSNAVQIQEAVCSFLETELLLAPQMLKVIPLGRATKDKPVPYLVQLNSKKDKGLVFSNCYRLNGKNISIMDELTKEQMLSRRMQLPRLIQLKQEGNKVYFKGDKLYLNGKPICDE
jgi:hypothetical protein